MKCHFYAFNRAFFFKKLYRFSYQNINSWALAQTPPRLTQNADSAYPLITEISIDFLKKNDFHRKSAVTSFQFISRQKLGPILTNLSMNLNFYKKRPDRRWWITLLTVMLLVSHVFAGTSRADVTVNGKVTAADDGSALPGVNVYLKGTQTGTITDGEGNYIPFR